MRHWQRTIDGGAPCWHAVSDDSAWRGDTHLEDPPVEDYGPEYWMWKAKLDSEGGATWPARC